MSPIVRIPTPLRAYAGGEREVTVRTGTVGDAITEVIERHPQLRRHLYTEDGALRNFVNLFLNEDEVRYLGGDRTTVAEGDTITIVPSIAGGAVGASAVADAADLLSPEEVLRYSRHLIMPEVAMGGQRKLKAARVLLVGTGGLGSPLGLYLAAAGVGTIGLVDFDVVDVTNLQRQVLYGTSDIGRPKLDAAAERLRDVNPHVQIIPHELRLTSENALQILESYDVVVDGTDNFPTRYLVNDACVLLGKPNVYGSIFRFEGQVSVFFAEKGPCYRCLFPEPPPPGLVPSCAEGGVLGVLPGIVGAVQALETIKLILGAGEPLIGRLLLFDALALRWRELKLRKNPDCPVCGERRTVTGLVDYEEFCGVPQAFAAEAAERDGLVEITASELDARLSNGEAITIIDVREAHEWEIANLERYDARLIPLGQFAERMHELNSADQIVVHCRSGVRSAKAFRQLHAAGFRRIWNLKGGILAWSDEVDPTLPRY